MDRAVEEVNDDALERGIVWLLAPEYTEGPFWRYDFWVLTILYPVAVNWEHFLEKLKLFTTIVDGISEVRYATSHFSRNLTVLCIRFIHM